MQGAMTPVPILFGAALKKVSGTLFLAAGFYWSESVAWDALTGPLKAAMSIMC